mgnify:CR=1 FL=1
MPSVDHVLSSFTPTGTPEAAAEAFAAHAEKAGFEAHVPKSFRAYGVNSVHLRHDGGAYHVLVHPGTASDLRGAVERFLALPSLDTEPRIVSAAEPPDDVAFLFSDDLLAAFERRLAREGQPDLKTRIADVGELVASLRPRLEAASGVTLTGDLETVTTGVDTIVQRLRSVGPEESMPEGSLIPARTLILLGLIATEAVRKALGCGQLMQIGLGGRSEIQRLSDVGGFPGIFTGNAAINVAGKVLKQFQNGEEDSVRFMASVVLAQHQANPPDEPVPLDGQVTSDASPEDVDALLQQRARYAPYAGFLAVALADDELEDAETEAFQSAISAAQDPFLLGLLDGDAEDRLAALKGDPDLTARSLAAVGVLLDREADGAAARASLMGPWRKVATAGGELGAVEEEALRMIEAMLDGGLAKATEGGVDQALEDHRDLMEAAKLAPWAAFLRVAGADGTVEIEELAAFATAYETTTDPLLRMLRAVYPVSAAKARTTLEADEDVGVGAIRSMARLLRVHPDGAATRGALIAMLERVVAVHGSVRPVEQKALDEVVRDLDFTGMTGCMVLSGVVFFAPMVAVWQFASAALGLTPFFVLGATLIEVVFLTLILMVTRRENNYVTQVYTGTASALFGAVPISITSVLVSWMYPDLAATMGGVFWGAISGFLGTFFTGLLWSMIAGFFLRKR